MKRHLLTLLLLISAFSVTAQFRTNGTAISQGNDCFRLTRNLTNQSGSVWYLNTVDISKPFDLYFEVNLGCSNGGADGMAFVLQQVSSSVGSSGGGLGYQGISPSVAIEFDTYQNGNWGDPVYDHIAIMSNGINDHTSTNNLAGPVAALSGNGNLEDCNFHDLRITWDTATFTLSVYLDCSLRLTYTGNIVQNIFNTNSQVFWGFTAATGAATNLHRFCLNYISFTQALQDTAICQGDTLDLDIGSGFTYVWTPAAGLSDSSVANPRAFPDTTTTYYVSVTDPCMNVRRDSITITVADPAALLFDLGPVDTILCAGTSLPYNLSRTGVDYLWQNGSVLPNFNITTPGQYWAELSNICGTNRDSINVQFEVIPVVDLGPDTVVCNSPNLPVNVSFMSQTTPGTQYLWDNGSVLPTFLVTQDDTVSVSLSNYCGTATDTLAVHFLDSPLPVDLGADTTLCNGDSLLLNAYQADMSHNWSTGSSDSAIWVNATASYQVNVSNACGQEIDVINITALATPFVNLGPDTTLCQGQSLTLTVTPSPTTIITWGDGSVSNSFIVTSPGIFRCFPMNQCGSSSDSIVVTYDSIPTPYAGPDSQLCMGEVITLDLSVPNATSYQWQGGPATAQYTVSSPAQYIGEATNRCGTGRDTVNISILDAPDIDLGPDPLLCDRDSLVIDYSGQNWTFQWQDGYDLSRRVIQDSGFYWLAVTNRCGIDRDSIEISEEHRPQLSLPIEDTAICAGEVLQMDIFASNIDSYLWSDSSTSSMFAAVDEGLYWAEVSNVCGTALDSFQLWLDMLPSPNLGPDTALCEGESINFNEYLIRASYLWHDGSVFATYLADREREYWVEVTNSCGTVRDEMNMIIDQKPPQIDLGMDQLLCEGDSFLLDASVMQSPTAPVRYQWLDGSEDSLRWITSKGLYRVEVINRCGKVYDLMEANFEQPLSPNLGADTLRCQNERIELNAFIDGVDNYLWQDGSREPNFLAGSAGIYAVTVENSCGMFSDSIRIEDTDCNCTVFVPSAFTPNGDQHNDGFCIGYECEFLNFDMAIYNRWGRLVWRTEDPAACWDGTYEGVMQPEGVYVYVLNYESRQNKREAKTAKSGTVTMIR